MTCAPTPDLFPDPRFQTLPRHRQVCVRLKELIKQITRSSCSKALQSKLCSKLCQLTWSQVVCQLRSAVDLPENVVLVMHV